MIWLVRIALVLGGAGVMWWEGQHQPAPGVGFAIALAMILGAAMIGADKEKDDE